MTADANVPEEAADSKENTSMNVISDAENSSPVDTSEEEKREKKNIDLSEISDQLSSNSANAYTCSINIHHAYTTHTTCDNGMSDEKYKGNKDDNPQNQEVDSSLTKDLLNEGLKQDLNKQSDTSLNDNLDGEKAINSIETNIDNTSCVITTLQDAASAVTCVAPTTEVQTSALKKEEFLDVDVELNTEKNSKNLQEANENKEQNDSHRNVLDEAVVESEVGESTIEKSNSSKEGSSENSSNKEATSGDISIGEGQSSTLSSSTSTVPHIFAFKKPKLKSASINREFFNKAPNLPTSNIHKASATQKEKNGTIFSRRGSFLQTSTTPALTSTTTTQTNPGKPRLATKISSPAPYSLGTYQESNSAKSLDGKQTTAKTSGFLGHNGAPVWGRNKKPPIREYTDEELSVMHGIRLVHRLSATSDDDKAGKWDEMDDDETDWSDTIEFADGTKFTLPHEDHTVSSTPVESQATPSETAKSPVWTPSWAQTQAPESTEAVTTQETAEKPISKEERFGEEHYDRSWNSQRPCAPQIYNVNTGKFDIVDDSTRNNKRAGRKPSTEIKAKMGQNISLLSRQRTSNHLKKEETTETHEQKNYKSINTINNESKNKQSALLTDSSLSTQNLVHYSTQNSTSTTGLTSTVKSTISQPIRPLDPMIDNIEAFQRAIMIEAKEKARLRREEEELERKLQQERAKKKAEELAKLAQKPKPAESIPFDKENKQSIVAKDSAVLSEPTSNTHIDISTISSQQKSPISTQLESKESNKSTEKKKNSHDSSNTKAPIAQAHKDGSKSSKHDSNIHETRSLETDSQNTSKSTFKKILSTPSTQSYLFNKKDGKSLETNKQKYVDSKQKYTKSAHITNQSNINDNWRKEHTNITERDIDETCISLNTSTTQVSPSNISFFSLEKKKSSVSATSRSSDKSSPSHSRTSSRFFPTTQTEASKSSDNVKEKSTSPTSESFKKQNILLSSKTSLNAAGHSVQTDHSNLESPIIILPQNIRTSQIMSTHSSKRPSNVKAVPTASTPAASLSSTTQTTHSEPNGSHSTRHSTRSSTRSFDDVMEQLARAGNFAQNNEKFASYLSVSKTPQIHTEDVLSVTTISPFEFEKYSKNTINVSLYSLNYSNDPFGMSSLSVSEKNGTKPFVNIPAASYVFTSQPSPIEQPKYFEPFQQHTMDFTLYDEQEIDTLRLYLPETSPKHIKIKSSNTFLCKKNTQMSAYNP